MPGMKQYSRVDTLSIKLQLCKKLGKQKSEKYFNLLHKFFTSRLSKSKFNKLCISIVGKENIPIHNLLIQSILKNVCTAKTPSPLNQKPEVKKTTVINEKTVNQSAVETVSLGSEPPPIEVVSVEDGEEVDQGVVSPGIQSRGRITPVLGVPWGLRGCEKKMGCLFRSNDWVGSCVSKGELPDSGCLRERMEVKLGKDGLGVSMECVNLVNSGLDVFVKGLIESILELSGSRAGNYGHKLNGGSGCGSVLDFRTAMELNPVMLGKDWPLLLEKVLHREFENCD